MHRITGAARRAVRTGRAGALALGALAWAVAARAQVDRELADRYFDEARVLCEREGGRLWGVSLCGPMVFADAATNTIATNRPVPEGERPSLLGYANSSVEWGGTRWATFVWPLPPDDPRARGGLMLHELFHRVQPELGFTFSEPKNDHLDTADGRYWLRLEWRALAKALAASGPTREEAIGHALAFRTARRAEFPGAAENERVLELQEGLAQYTGVVASTSGAEEAVDVAIEQLGREQWLTSLVRTFAYGSGTAYGVLLDAFSPGWTRRLKPTDDLGDLLVSASGLAPAGDAAGTAAAYGAVALRAAEDAREAERKARVAELRRRFVDGPVLVLPDAGSYSFESEGITPLGEHGSVYPTVRATSDWGELEAARVLVGPDYRLAVPGPFEIAGDTIRGEDWTLVLTPGWGVRPGPRPGDREVVERGREDPLDPYVAFLDQRHEDSVDYVLGLFEDHDLVILCERAHPEVTQYRLILDLVRDPRFTTRVGHLFTEVGLRNLQPRLAGLMATPGLDEQEVRERLIPIYRDITIHPLWNRVNFFDFLVSVYRRNQTLDPSRRIEVEFTDVAWSWEGVTAADHQAFWRDVVPERDRRMAERIAERLRALRSAGDPRPRGLVIMNYRHAFNDFTFDDGTRGENVGRYLFEAFPGRVANVMLSSVAILGGTDEAPQFAPIQGGRWDAAFRRAGLSEVGFDFAGSPFGADQFDFFPFRVDTVSYEDVFTGFVFYRHLPEHAFVDGLPGLVDEEYLPELRRRYGLAGSDIPDEELHALVGKTYERETYDDLPDLERRIRSWLGSPP